MAERGVRVGSSRHVLAGAVKSLWTVVALALALAFVSGSLIAVDSTQKAVVRSEIDKIPVDFIGTGMTTDAITNPTFLDYRIPDIETFEGVEEVEPVVVLTQVSVANSEGAYPPYYPGYLSPAIFLQSESQKVLDSYRIVGTMPDPGNVALPYQMASDLNVSAGDTVTLEFTDYVTEYTADFTVSDIWIQDDFKDQVVYFPDGSSQYYENVDPRAVLFRQYLNPVVLNLEDLYPLMQGLGAGSSLWQDYLTDSETLYLIWIDRGDYVDFSDTGGSIDALDVLYGPLSSLLASRGIDSQRSDLVWVLGPWHMGDVGAYRVRYLGLALPVLALGVYVSLVGAGINADMKGGTLQELSALGVRRRSLIGRMTAESIITGLLAGVLGLVLGIFASRWLMGPIADSVGAGFNVSVSNSDLTLTWFTILVTLGIGALVVLLASFFALLRATRPPRMVPSELEALKILPIAEVILISLSLVSIFAIIGGQRWVGSHGFDWYFGSVSVMLDNIGLVLFPAMPFMLAVALVSLFTRWPVSVQRKLMGVFSSESKDVKIPLGAMADRCDKRARRMCVIIALAITFGLFVSVATETFMQNEESDIRFGLGSDVAVYAGYNGGWNGTGWFPESEFPDASELTTIPEVSHVSLYQYFGPTIVGKGMLQGVAIDGSDYLDTVQPSDKYFGSDAEEALEGLDEGGKAFLSELYADEFDLEVGSAIRLEVRVNVIGEVDQITYSMNVIISHVVDGLPGIEYANLIIGYASLSSIPGISLDHASNGCGAIIDTEADADQDIVGAEAVQVFRDDGYDEASFQTIDTRLAELESDPDFGGLSQFLAAEFVASMAVVLAGVAITSYATARFATSSSMESGGSASFLRSVRNALVSESLALGLVGAVVGIGVGLLTVVLFGIMWVPSSEVPESAGTTVTSTVAIIAVVSFVLIVVFAVLASLYGSSRKPIKLSGKP